MDATDKLDWKFNAPGTTTADVTWRGLMAQATFNAFDPDLGPTASAVTVTGRVLTSDGFGIGGARVVLTGSNGEQRTALTSAFGYFRLEDVSAGETVVVTVLSKRYTFAPLIVTLTDELTELNIAANP